MNRVFSSAGWALALLLLLFCSRRLRQSQKLKRYGGTFFLAFAALLLTLCMVRFPEEAFSAALAGLVVWWEVVFPALLPFFIFSEILMGLGVVSAMGVMLEPLMRPLFNVPGVGSFVMAMGLASGYPIGAILTARLRRQNSVTQVEAERLLSFTNTADPLFMFGAVAVGMFADARLGIAIAVAHYLSSLSVGLIMRFYGRGQKNTPDVRHGGESIVMRSMKELYRARMRDGRPLGQLLGDAVKNSVNSLLMIGGFIILFSVIIQVFSVVGLVALMAQGLTAVLGVVGLSANLSGSIISGIFEITIGTQTCAQASAPLPEKIAMAGAIIAWSGLSVHAQVASIVNDTDIRIKPYLLARCLHAVLAFTYTIVLWDRLEHLMGAALPVFMHTDGSPKPIWSLQAMVLRVVMVLTLLAALALVARLLAWLKRRVV